MKRDIEEPAEYTMFSRTTGTFTEMNKVGHRRSLIKCQRLAIRQRIFPNRYIII
jgi:hypothetical protein